MKTVHLIQGTPEWHTHRAQHHNASDAPAMLGCSPYKTRAQLVREVATGIVPEADAATQKRFEDGHRYEALARPLAEKIIGEELYPVVGVEGKYSASFDGLTLLEDTAFEHKSLNDSLRYTPWDEGNGWHLPKHYQVQMEHQLMVSDAERVLFMASKWNGDDLVEERHCWYASDAVLRAEIIAGWEQFEADVAAYTPEVEPALPTGRAPENLPSLSIQVTGMVTASNLAEFKASALAVLGSINRDLQTDEDFANAEKTVTWCKGVEERIEATKQQVLGQTADIDAVFRTMDEVSAETRRIRLELDKLVSREKESRRAEIVSAGVAAVHKHIEGLNASLRECAMPAPAGLQQEVGLAIKGKRSLSSMRDAVDAVVTRHKIDSSQQAERVRANMAILAEHQAHAHLFADRVVLCIQKEPADLRNLIAARIAEHQQREQQRLETERERIRQEELARLEREQRQREQEARRAEQAEQHRAKLEADVGNVAPSAAAAPTVVGPAAAGTARTAPTGGARIRLGEINAAIAPLSITADGLAQLGFRPVAQEKAAKLYDAGQLSAMSQALQRVITRLGAGDSALEHAA